MKFLLLAALIALANSESQSKTIDWSSVKPLNEIKEWRDAHPHIEAVKKNYAVIPPPRSRRILNGDIANPLEYPYVVGVMLHFDTGNSWCGGSLVSVNFALTAADCVFIVPSASVVLGAHDMNFVQEVIRVSSIRSHPSYDPVSGHNDIATLQLSLPAVLGPQIGLVRLPNRRQVGTSFENQGAVVLGWGRTQTGTTQPIPTQLLRTLSSNVITNLSCRIRYPTTLADSNVCTNPEAGTPCEGDEGGPLMIVEADGRRTQIGIYSYQFALGCGLGWPPVYTRTTSFLDFIEQNSDVRILDDWE